ncbi:MAG: hypothetical protein HYT71_00105 [Candidatus Aenigmarchaeota archaeon]|nr:hypothetical protein [Candidatus Aenigmarchaeota archaeon]
MAKRIQPEYAKEYWNVLQRGLFFESSMPEIWEFENLQESNDWMKKHHAVKKRVSLGFLKPAITFQYEPMPSAIPGESSFMLPATEKEVLMARVLYQNGKLSEEAIMQRNFKHKEVFSGQLILIPTDGAETAVRHLESGGYHVPSTAMGRKIGIIHELCEHAATHMNPSYTFVVNSKLERAHALSQNPNADQDYAILEGAAAHAAQGHRHTMVNMIETWALDQFGEDGRKIVRAQNMGVLNMFADIFKKYKTPEDIKNNYGVYVGEMMAFMSSFHEYTLLGQLLTEPAYKGGVRNAADEHIRGAVWRMSHEQLQDLQARSTKYMETRGFRNVTPGKN